MTDKPANAEVTARDSHDDAPGTGEAGVVIPGGQVSITVGAILNGASIVISLPETVAAATALTIFCKAFLETLGRRAGENAVNLLDRVHIKAYRKSEANEYYLGVEGGATATVVITEDLPDEARLALLDLDVTSGELRGKLLRWDTAAWPWHAASGQ